MEHVRLDPSPLLKPRLYRPRLREHLRHVPREQLAVDRVHQTPAFVQSRLRRECFVVVRWLSQRLRRKAGAECRPLIVVLPHPVVEGMNGMTNGVARIPEADHLVDRPTILSDPDAAHTRTTETGSRDDRPDTGRHPTPDASRRAGSPPETAEIA